MPFYSTLVIRFRRLVAFSCALVSVSVSAAGPAGAPAGKVVSVIGSARVGERPARPGDGVFPGDEIRTAEKSGVKLLMVDRSVIDIAASSSFKVSEFKTESDGSRSVDAALDFGTVRASVSKKLDKKSKFFIRTKSSVLAVRGTEVIVQWQQVGNQVNHRATVVEGNAVFTPGGGQPPVNLGQGNQFNSSGSFQNNVFRPSDSPGGTGTTGGTGAPGGTGTSGLIRLSATQMNDVIATGRVNDHTFEQSIVVGGDADRGRGMHGSETFTSLTGTVEGHNGDRRPASTISVRDVPSAVGQDIENFLPGFSGIPGVNRPNPGGGIGSIPQLPVNVTVVLVPASAI